MVSIVFFSVGNPGKAARHSVGHYVLKHLADALGAKQLVKKGPFSASSLDNVHFVKSNAYMNDLGALLRRFLASERLGRCVVFVICDDFEIPLSRVRVQPLRKNESHNGLKSVAREVDSAEVLKFGIGIGPKPTSASRDTMAAWVLADFNELEKAALPTMMHLVYRYVDAILAADGEIDCNKLNARVKAGND